MSRPWRRRSPLWVAVPLAVVLAVVALARLHPLASATPAASKTDEVSTEEAELRRCRHAGATAASDPNCQAAWRGAWGRFLGSRK